MRRKAMLNLMLIGIVAKFVASAKVCRSRPMFLFDVWRSSLLWAVLISIALGPGVCAQSLPESPFVEYTFDHGTATNRQNPGTYDGNLFNEAQIAGDVLQLNDDASYLEVAGGRTVTFNSGIRVEARIQRLANTNEDAVVGKWYDPDQWLLTVYPGGSYGAGQLLFGVNFTDGTRAVLSYSMPNTGYLGSWIEVAASYDPQTGMELYWNDLRVAWDTTVTGRTILGGSSPIHVGNAGPGTTWSTFGGAIDNVKIWSDIPGEGGSPTQDDCAADCSPWVWQSERGDCHVSQWRWRRHCDRGKGEVVQYACSPPYHTPGICLNNAAFLPGLIDSCTGSCEEWTLSAAESCGGLGWTRECLSANGSRRVWEESCTAMRPGSCNVASSCTCENGRDWLDQEYDPAAVYCGRVACGADGQYYDCGVDGWQAIGGSCPDDDDRPATVCTYPRTGPIFFPNSTLAVKSVNYFPGEHYQGKMWRNWDYRLIVEDLDILHDMNVNTLRVFLHEADLGSDFGPLARGRVDRFLCEARSRGMRVVFTLLPDSPGYPCDADLTLVSRDWIAQMVTTYSQDPNILLWELINEPFCGGVEAPWATIPDAVQVRLATDLAYLHAYTDQAVSVPVLQDQMGSLHDYFLAQMDVINFHLYDHDPDLASDSFRQYFQTASDIASGRPVFIGEFGCLAAPFDASNGQQDRRYCNLGNGTRTELEEDQANWMESVYDTAVEFGIDGIAPWMFSETAIYEPGTGDQNSEYALFPAFGLVDLDNTLKPAGQRLRDLYGDCPNFNKQACQVSLLDVVLLVDTTGSMWDDIAHVKSEATAIVDAVADITPDYRVAVADFRDFPVSPYGGPGDYPYHLGGDFSTDRGAILCRPSYIWCFDVDLSRIRVGRG